MLRFLSRFPGAVFLAAALPLAVSAPTCGGDSACTTPPVGAITAYTLSPTTRFEAQGTVVSLSPPREDGLQELVLRDAASGGLDTLRYGIYGHPELLVPIPLAPGAQCRVRLEQVGGFPAASGLLIQDDAGVLLAAVTDRGPGDLVLTEGIPGFALSLESANCPSRPVNPCLTYLRNLKLRVGRAEASVELFHGEEAALEGYRILCLTAQEAGYTDDCNDAAQVGFSCVILRVPAE